MNCTCVFCKTALAVERFTDKLTAATKAAWKCAKKAWGKA
jgi:hypothetical protein